VQTRINLECGVLHELRGQQARSADRHKIW
jgi:hypothetical protein